MEEACTYRQSTGIPIMSLEIYQNMIKQLQQHNIRNEQVYHLQIDSLKQKLKQKDQTISEMSRRMNSLEENTHSEMNDQPSGIEEASLSAFTVEKNVSVGVGGAVEEMEANNQTYANMIEEQTKCLKQELNELFKAKQAEAKIFNACIDELKLQILDYQTEKMGVLDANQQLASDNTKLLTQLQQTTGACNHLRQICSQQVNQIQARGQECRTLTFEVENLREQLRLLSEHNAEQVSEKMNELIAKETQLQEMMQINSGLLSQIQSLKKEKQVKKQHTQKQHKLIVQYQKKNEQNIKQIRRLEGELLTVTNQLDTIRNKNNRLEAQNKSTSQMLEKELTLKQSLNQTKNNAAVQKYRTAVYKLADNLRELTTEVKQELAELKGEFDNCISVMTEFVMQTAANLANIQFKSVGNGIQGSNVSTFNREEMLEFESEQLKKELLILKKQNFQLKYQNKKYIDKRQIAKRRQQQLKAQIARLKQQIGTAREYQKLETEQIEQVAVFRLSDVANKTAVQARSRSKKVKEPKSRKESGNDQKIIQQITQMRKRIRDVRQECQLKSTR